MYSGNWMIRDELQKGQTISDGKGRISIGILRYTRGAGPQRSEGGHYEDHLL